MSAMWSKEHNTQNATSHGLNQTDTRIMSEQDTMTT